MTRVLETMLAQGNVPFFTNDWEGALKVLGVVLSIAGPVILSVWKIMQGPLQGQIDGLGRRLNETQTTCTQNAVGLDDTRRRAERAEFEANAAGKAVARLESVVAALGEQSVVNKTEIIEQFQQRAQHMLEAVHEIENSLVRVETVLELDARRRRKEP
ncbi:MAG TPA: hypothetical protein VK420_00830 [Longimicrobium sp.]|jgi:hypothetical protein|nr:hypothetical protein [Longimicrobium sp.]